MSIRTRANRVGLLVLLGVFVVGISFSFQMFNATSNAMLPAVGVGQTVVMRKWDNSWFNHTELTRGQVIVFAHPELPDDLRIGRLMGLPGDRLEYRNKQLFINDKAVTFNVIYEKEKLEIRRERLGDRQYEVLLIQNNPANDFIFPRVPEKHYFIMGDNRDAIEDQREWGILTENRIRGRVIYGEKRRYNSAQ